MGKSTSRADKQAEIHPCSSGESESELYRCQSCQGKLQAIVPFRFDQESYGQNRRVGQIRRKMADTAGTCRPLKLFAAVAVPPLSPIKAARSAAVIMVGLSLVISSASASDLLPSEPTGSVPEKILV